jgi:hypothetical protein
LTTGKFKDPRRVDANFVGQSILNPLSALGDKNLKWYEKWGAMSGLGGLFAGKRRERMEAENIKEAAKYKGIQDQIEGLTEYEVAPEAQQKLEMLEQAGESAKGFAGEATDIARSRTGQDAPGMALEKNDIRNAVADKLQAIQEFGGSRALSAITQTGAKSQAAMGGLNRQNTAYKQQAQKDLSNALRAEAQTGVQAAQMGAAGLQGMVQERGKVHESKLNKALTALDFKQNMLAREQMGTTMQMQAQAASQAGMSSALSEAGAAWLNSRQG